MNRGFSKLPKLACIGIFVLLKYENKLVELVMSDISFNSLTLNKSEFVFESI